MSAYHYSTEKERIEAKRQSVRESNRRARANQRGEGVPADPKGIARWWKKRGH